MSTFTDKEKAQFMDVVASNYGATPAGSLDVSNAVFAGINDKGEWVVDVPPMDPYNNNGFVYEIPITDIAERVGDRRVCYIGAEGEITPQDALDAFNRYYSTLLIMDDIDPVTWANFPIPANSNGVVFKIADTSRFYKGQVSIMFSNDKNLFKHNNTDAKTVLPLTEKPLDTIMLAYKGTTPGETFVMLDSGNLPVDGFKAFPNVTTVNSWTVTDIFKLKDGRFLVQGSFDIEVVLDPAVGPVAIPDGTMMLVDKLTTVLSVDTTPLDSTEVFVVSHPDSDTFVALYNVSGNFAVVKSYPYDLTQTPNASTLPIGPISAAVMDSNGDIYVGTRPDTTTTPVETRVSRLRLGATGYYSTDSSFSSPVFTNALDGTDSCLVEDIAINGDTIGVFISPVTYYTRSMFDPVLNGTNVRLPPLPDTNLFFGYSPVFLFDKTGTQVLNAYNKLLDRDIRSLDAVSPAHPSDNGNMDPINDVMRRIWPGIKTDHTTGFVTLTSVEYGLSGRITVAAGEAINDTISVTPISMEALKDSYMHKVLTSDLGIDGRIYGVGRAFKTGDPTVYRDYIFIYSLLKGERRRGLFSMLDSSIPCPDYLFTLQIV